MTGAPGDKNPSRSDPDQHRSQKEGTVLDRIKMPPMSGEEALRHFSDERASDAGATNAETQSDLAELHPVMKLVALGGTLLLVVGGLLGVLYLFNA
jgi:hypothetical protein